MGEIKGALLAPAMTSVFVGYEERIELLTRASLGGGIEGRTGKISLHLLENSKVFSRETECMDSSLAKSTSLELLDDYSDCSSDVSISSGSFCELSLENTGARRAWIQFVDAKAHIMNHDISPSFVDERH
eukprot:TRINITY_DN33712_c0_g1_i1.p1 TRINITY_DN33712_c0_g1~~TRINITY_DN33712_c0_g1_i1.p1  ORF type:complete len:130 (+),score=15.64 TRINITY_DN33712_c0_g1_i1:87-476(+)